MKKYYSILASLALALITPHASADCTCAGLPATPTGVAPLPSTTTGIGRSCAPQTCSTAVTTVAPALPATNAVSATSTPMVPTASAVAINSNGVPPEVLIAFAQAIAAATAAAKNPQAPAAPVNMSQTQIVYPPAAPAPRVVYVPVQQVPQVRCYGFPPPREYVVVTDNNHNTYRGWNSAACPPPPQYPYSYPYPW